MMNFRRSRLHKLPRQRLLEPPPPQAVRRSTAGGVTTRSLFGRKGTPHLPPVFAGRAYSIDYGLQAPLSRDHRVLSLHTKLLLASALTLLPLTWWFDSSVAFYDPLAYKSNLLYVTAEQKVNQLSLPEIQPLPTVPESSPWLYVNVTEGDTLSTLFEEYGLDKSHLYEIIGATGKHREALRQLRPEQTVRIKQSANGEVEALTLELDFFNELYVEKGKKGFKGVAKPRAVEKRITSAYGFINTSLFATGQSIELSDRLISDIVGICRWDVDFQPSDYFGVVYEQYVFEGEIKEGNVLAVELVSTEETCRAVRYTDKAGKSGYYKPDGTPLHKEMVQNPKTGTSQLFISPVEYTKISSLYGMRTHPIFGKDLFHKGVDYGAPTGTPIYATADATVEFIGDRGGYGKTVILQHDEHYTTLYAHLSDYIENLKVADKVEQWQIIGYVGQTGTATGSHLHYELQVDGEPQNPLGAPVEKTETTVAAVQDEKPDFQQQIKPILAQLDKINRQVQPFQSSANQPRTLAEVVKKTKR